MQYDTVTGYINFVINQKSDFEVWLNIKDDQTNSYFDLTSYSIAAAYTNDLDDSTNNVTIHADIVDATTGEIKLHLSSSETSLMEGYMKYFYDVTITDVTNDFKTRIMQGTIKVTPGVS